MDPFLLFFAFVSMAGVTLVGCGLLLRVKIK